MLKEKERYIRQREEKKKGKKKQGNVKEGGEVGHRKGAAGLEFTMRNLLRY